MLVGHNEKLATISITPIYEWKGGVIWPKKVLKVRAQTMASFQLPLLVTKYYAAVSTWKWRGLGSNTSSRFRQDLRQSGDQTIFLDPIGTVKVE